MNKQIRDNKFLKGIKPKCSQTVEKIVNTGVLTKLFCSRNRKVG